MINRTYFVPQHWEARQGDIEWAIKEFSITVSEVYRQIELFRDHEYRRAYSDWNRCFRNWMRKAEDIGTLRREYKMRLVEDTPEDVEERDRKWREQMERFGVKVGD